MSNYHFTRKSQNRKTGPIPTTVTSADTCPDACPLKAKGCYAKGGPLAMHWRALLRNTTRARHPLKRYPTFPAKA
jgi:hypothetical protein